MGHVGALSFQLGSHVIPQLLSFLHLRRDPSMQVAAADCGCPAIRDQFFVQDIIWPQTFWVTPNKGSYFSQPPNASSGTRKDA